MTSVAEKMLAMPEAARHRITESTLMAKETLKLASKADMDSTVEPVLTDYTLDRMTNDELDAMFKEYSAIVDRVNPTLEVMPVQQLKQLYDDLVKKKESGELDLALIELSSWERVNLVRFFLTKED